MLPHSRYLLALPCSLLALLPGCSSATLDSGEGGAPGSGGQLEGAGGSSWGSGGTASGGAPSGGAPSGGSASGGASTGGAPAVVPWPEGPVVDGVSVRVRNFCPFPLYIGSEGQGGGLPANDAALPSGEIRNYVAPRTWVAARVSAYKDGPHLGELDKVEMTFGPADGGLAVLNYNITYVDWVGLPAEMQGIGGNCNDTHFVGCSQPVDQLLDGCPEDFLLDGGRCLSPRSYCANPAHQGEAHCHALDSAIQSCIQNVAGCAKYNGQGLSTPAVYACSPPIHEDPRICAALNRGMLSAPDDADDSHYYQTTPHNTYAKWVHQVCPGIYAFSYDDWNSHGGFRSCAGSELRITFCPGG